MTDFSGIPRSFGITDAKRAREAEARKREQATSARNTSSTTIGAGGKLDLDGGDLTVFNGGNAVVKDGGVWRVEDGGGGEIVDGGKLSVIGVGDYNAAPYEVSMTIENFETSSAVWGKVLSPGLNFKSLLTATDGYARLYSRNGSGIRAETYDPAFGYSSLEVNPSEASMSWSVEDEYRTISVTDGSMRVLHYDHTTNIQAGMTQYGTELRVGHSSPFNAIRSLLRTNRAGALSLESSGTDDAALTMPGDGTVDITGTFTVNGLPVSGGGAVSSVNTKTGAVVLVKDDIGLGNVDNTSDANKPISNDTSTALTGKASTALATSSTNGLMSAADKIKLNSAATTNISHYISTGNKGNYAAGDQQISTPVYQPGNSTTNLGTPSVGQITITEAGIYAVTFSIGWFTTAALTSIKPMTGRSFIDISDNTGTPYSRTAVPVSEDIGTGAHSGLLLSAGEVLKFNILQTSGGVAYYRARIWLTKLP